MSFQVSLHAQEDGQWADSTTAAEVLPYAYLANDSYNETANGSEIPAGYKRIGTWEDIYRLHGLDSKIIGGRLAGFFATIYSNRDRELVISYQGTKGWLDAKGIATDVEAQAGEVPAQYLYAKQLALLIKKSNPTTPLTVTGHSKGGGEATYVGEHVPGVTKVVTFNAAGPPFLAGKTNAGQINVAVPGELIGDPNTKSFLGPTQLPGKLYYVHSDANASGPNATGKSVSPLAETASKLTVVQDASAVFKDDLGGEHLLGGMIGGLRAAAKIETAGSQQSVTATTSTPLTAAPATADSTGSIRNSPAAQSSPTQSPTPRENPSRVASIQTAPAAAYVAPQSTFAAARPGGISLSKAAAERMPFNFSIEGASVNNGRIVLSGRSSSDSSIDAALFLTALRATCEGRDPYFSLDPDDIALWLQESEKGGEEFFEHIKKDTTWSLQKRATRNSSSILNFRTISASQSYPAYWTSLLAKYPHLRSRLVFAPEWLRHTRFGEILYRADVLLKELAGGVSLLGAPQLRASKIDDYLSATQIASARRLLYKYHNLPDRKASVAGGRIWYDLSETSDVAAEGPESIPAVSSELHTLLQTRHLLRDNPASAIFPVSLQQSDGSLDISDVFPRMYVRVRDPVTLRDGAGSLPGVNELVAAANRSPHKYAAAYKEYRALVEVFRAYVAAVHARRTEPRLCAKLPKDLLDAERLSTALPEYHSTDLALTIGWYEYSDGRFRRAIGVTDALFQGGVSVGATRLFGQIAPSGSDTPILRELKAESTKMYEAPTWTGDSGRQFVAFTFDDVAASVPPVRPANVSLKEGQDFGPPVVPLAPRPAVPPKEERPKEQRSAQWEQRLGDKVAQAVPSASSVATGPRREMKPEEVAIPAVFVVVLLAILVRLLAGSPSAQANSRASRGKASQGPVVFAMPDLSSPGSVPYVPSWQKDSNWKAQAQTASSSGQQDTVLSDSGTHVYDAVERDFKNIFAIKSRADKEQMIGSWRNIHGGSREDAMRRLVEQWRHDNRD